MALKIISQNPERYAEILKEEKANPNLFGFSPEMQALMRLEEELKNADLTKSEETDNK